MDKLTNVREDYRMLKAENEFLKRVAEDFSDKNKALENELSKLKEEKLIARIKAIDDEIDRYKYVLNNSGFHAFCKELWVYEYYVNAIEEKIERLELEKAKLRTEGC